MAEKHNPVQVTSILTQQPESIAISQDATDDDRALGSLGYKQEFKRDFTILESFSVSFSVLGILPSVASTIGFSLGYAGTAGAIWGWLIPSLAIQCTALSMAELCSSMPTAGSLYYAAAVLAPPGWSALCSWVVGWSNFLAFAIAPCSIDYALASMLVTCGEIVYPDYVAQAWHIYLALVAILVTQAIITMQPTRFIGWVHNIGGLWNFLVVIIFIIWAPVGSVNTPKVNDNSVWTNFENTTEWPIGWAVIMGFLTTTYTLAGYDTPMHLSEECSNAAIAGPRAIIMTASIGAGLGWAIILVICYTVTNVNDVVSGQYGQPFGSLCLQVLGEKAGLTMFAFNIVAQYFVGTGVMVASSRIAFAFSRDGALPGSRLWSRVSSSSMTPVMAIWLVTGLGCLVGLLLFASAAAINAVFTISSIGQYTAFTIPIALKLFFDRGRFRPGPFSLGRFSKPSGAIATAFWLLLLPALCWPAVKGADLTLLTMNWTVVIYGGTMALALGYYLVSARRWFSGPRLNIEHIDMQVPVKA